VRAREERDASSCWGTRRKSACPARKGTFAERHCCPLDDRGGRKEKQDGGWIISTKTDSRYRSLGPAARDVSEMYLKISRTHDLSRDRVPETRIVDFVE
jgi:hypothetical protein